MQKQNPTLGLDTAKKEDYSEDLSRSLDKSNKLTQLKNELETTQKEQVTDIYADFPTRLGRYVKIKLLRHTINHFNK